MESLFFDSQNHDRVYYAKNFAWYFSNFIGNGVFASPTDGMQVRSVGGLKLTIQAGACYIGGYAGKAEGTDTLTLVHGGTLPRIDRIVIRLDLSKRAMYPVIIKGQEEASPKAPDIIRNSTVYDIGLACVTVGANAALITQANVRDTRPDTAVCGFVKGLIDQIDASEMFIEFQTAWDEFIESLGDSDHVTINTADEKARAFIFREKIGERFSDLFRLL